MSEQEAHDLIRKQVTSNDIVQFMKGTKQSPQCGFSGQVAQILDHLGVDYKDIKCSTIQESVRVPRVREGTKSYTAWPTIPAALCQRRVRWRLRYRPRNVSIGRAAGGRVDGTARGRGRNPIHGRRSCRLMTASRKATVPRNPYRKRETRAMTTASITVTARAAERIAQIVCNEPDKKIFRISVEGGGCSGFEYHFDLVPKAEPEDAVIEHADAKVVVDSLSLVYLAGSEIDYVDDLISASFKIKNPNATAGCGCGTSFSV